MGCTLVLVVAERLKRCCRVVVVPGFPSRPGANRCCLLFFLCRGGCWSLGGRNGSKKFLHILYILFYKVLVVILKKDEKNGEKIWKMVNHCFIFAPVSREGREGKRLKEGPEKKFEKSLKSLENEKQALPLQPLSRGGDRREDREREKTKRQRVL